jgi:para-aminobenzoate synthetase/4-amino-4-deoxychorismate lyase
LADHRALRLDLTGTAGEIALALDADPDLDTAVLACLSGRWAGGECVSFGALATVSGSAAPPGDAADGRSAAWFGWQAYQPELSFWARLRHAVVRDDEGRWWLHTDDDIETAERTRDDVQRAGGRGRPGHRPARLVVTAMTDEQQHLRAVEEAIIAIRAGDLYQVNVCARIAADLHGDPLALYADGVRTLSPDYAAFVRGPDRTVISFSPELFLDRDGARVSSAPIKGTRRRAQPVGDQTRDERPAVTGEAPDATAAELRRSPKDRAENVMIVDLTRNDLSRVCRVGSVRASRLLEVRPAPGVWHLVSTVDGELRDGVTDADLLAATFPPGSVTGAPKSAAVRLIDALETARRGVFTGAVGVLGIGDRSTLNVAIRTVEITGSPRPGLYRAEIGVGGGITADSVPSEEWRECLIKAAPILGLGGVLLSTDPAPAPAEVDVSAGVFDTLLSGCSASDLTGHLDRLAASVRELYGLELPPALQAEVRRAAARPGSAMRVRSSVDASGRSAVVVTEALSSADGIALCTARGRRDSWRHKWNDRGYLERWESSPGRLPLFVGGGPDPLVYETSRSNVVLLTAGPDAPRLSRPGSRCLLATPALSDQVLPGIARRRLLDLARDLGWTVRLGDLRLGDLLDGAGQSGRLVACVNSAGVVGVERIDDVRLGVDTVLLDELRELLAP